MSLQLILSVDSLAGVGKIPVDEDSFREIDIKTVVVERIEMGS